MIMKRVSIVLWLFSVSMGSAISLLQEGPSSGQLENGRLMDILQKTGEYCARLERISLYFVCLEQIEEKIFDPYRNLEGSVGWWKTEENNYLYDYQLIRKGDIEESRILLKMNGKELNAKGSPLKTKRFLYKYVIFGPIGIFGFEAQKRHDFTVEKETKLWGIPALIIMAVPKNQEEEKWLYGRAWLDKVNGSILKTEWEEKSVKNYEAMREFAKTIGAQPGLKQKSEYGIEKNGIRFPSQFIVIEDYYQKRTVETGVRVITKSTLAVKYKDYKFFTVETEEAVKK